jgi:hypothetical protein
MDWIVLSQDGGRRPAFEKEDVELGSLNINTFLKESPVSLNWLVTCLKLQNSDGTRLRNYVS